jgi:glycine/D-amino acid oxidase-like deaminating enzyme
MTEGIDTVIVGAGLAGSILAWKLMQAGQRIHIIHHTTQISASRVAAGIINPVTGQRLVLQKNIETLLPTAKGFYHDLSERFHQQFYTPKPMLRILRNNNERTAWNKRKHDPHYQSYLSAIAGREDAIMQHQTGYLDTKLLLNHLHHYFKQQGCLMETNRDTYDTDTCFAKHMILCQGWRSVDCPFFSYLPFQPAKGEILTLTSQNKLPNYMINQGKWLLPIDANTCKLGASYQTQFTHENTSKEHAKALMHELKNMLLGDMPEHNFNIQAHEVGVRPNTQDKQPFLGFHHKHAHIGIFNGFGSKGSLLIPWYAEQMTRHILHQTPLPKHADIQRFACA